jgi:hypothetical protein
VSSSILARAAAAAMSSAVCCDASRRAWRRPVRTGGGGRRVRIDVRRWSSSAVVRLPRAGCRHAARRAPLARSPLRSRMSRRPAQPRLPPLPGLPSGLPCGLSATQKRIAYAALWRTETMHPRPGHPAGPAQVATTTHRSPSRCACTRSLAGRARKAGLSSGVRPRALPPRCRRGSILPDRGERDQRSRSRRRRAPRRQRLYLA